jgi:hypothetical protein
VNEQIAAVETTPAPTDDDAYGALFDKLTADGIDPEPEQEDIAHDAVQEEEAQGLTEAEPEQAEPEAKAEEPAPVVEVPPDLPAGIKAKWATMPEEARDAVLSSHRDLSRKLADQGRVVQAARPVYDVLVQAAQQIPTMRDMTPDQIARDVFAMAQIQGQLATDPVRTLLGVAQQYGAMDALKQALSGQAAPAAQENIAMANELREARAQLQRLSDPSAIQQQVTQTLTTRDTERMVMEYAGQKAHWADVEPQIPVFIPMAKQRLGEGASAQDVLDAAYDMAIHANPDLRSKLTPPAPQPAPVDTARQAAQMKAKSVNVTSRPGTQKQPTEMQALGAVWDKYRG